MTTRFNIIWLNGSGEIVEGHAIRVDGGLIVIINMYSGITTIINPHAIQQVKALDDETHGQEDRLQAVEKQLTELGYEGGDVESPRDQT